MPIAAIFDSPWWNATPGFAFAFWLLVFPNGFWRFYKWAMGKHASKVQTPKPVVIRFIGALLLVMIFITFYF